MLLAQQVMSHGRAFSEAIFADPREAAYMQVGLLSSSSPLVAAEGLAVCTRWASRWLLCAAACFPPFLNARWLASCRWRRACSSPRSSSEPAGLSGLDVLFVSLACPARVLACLCTRVRCRWEFLRERAQDARCIHAITCKIEATALCVCLPLIRSSLLRVCPVPCLADSRMARLRILPGYLHTAGWFSEQRALTTGRERLPRTQKPEPHGEWTLDFSQVDTGDAAEDEGRALPNAANGWQPSRFTAAEAEAEPAASLPASSADGKSEPRKRSGKGR